MRFQQLLKEHLQIPVAPSGHHHARPGWVQIDCPFCSPGTGRFRLGFRESGNYLSCWKCGRHTLWDFLVEVSGGRTEAARLIRLVDRENRPVETSKPLGRVKLPAGVGALQKAHIRYLSERGIDPDYAAKIWDVRGIGIADRLSWRLFLPAYYRGSLVSWTTRSIGKDVDLRYITAREDEEAVPLKSFLYGQDLARHTALIFEGPLDAVLIGPGSMATCGTSYTRKQLFQMAKFPLRYVCFDNEPTAQQRAQKLCDDLMLLPGTTYNICLDAKDAGEANEKERRQLRKLLN